MWMSTSKILSLIHLILLSDSWRWHRESAFIAWYSTCNLQDFPISWLASRELPTLGGRLWKSLVTSILRIKSTYYNLSCILPSQVCMWNDGLTWALKSCDVLSSFCSGAPMQDSTTSLSSSLYEMVDTPAVTSALEIPPCANENLLPMNYMLQTQSSHLYDDTSIYSPLTWCSRLYHGGWWWHCCWLVSRWDFWLSHQWSNFCRSFISTGKLFDTSNFKSKVMTASFLNQMVTTISDFLCTAKETSLKPLHYFSSTQLDTLLLGHPAKVKPDILIVPLIDGCIKKGSLRWTDVHSLIEHTQEKKSPHQMSETIQVKTYMTFCNHVRDPLSCTLTQIQIHSGWRNLKNVLTVISTQTTSDLYWEQVPDKADHGILSECLRLRLLKEFLERKVLGCHLDV